MIERSPDAWETLLTALDQSRPVLHGDQVQGSSGEFLSELEQASLCQELPHARSMACTGCYEQPFCEVVFSTNAEEKPKASLPCPHCGLVEVSLDSLRRWQIDRDVFAAITARSLGVTSNMREIRPGRLWSLGRLQSGRTICSVWLGYRLSRRDAIEILTAIQSAGRVLLVVPDRLPAARLPDHMVVASLREQTRWSEGQIVWDQESLDDLLTFAAPEPTSRSASSRRQSRAGDIEALTAELKLHLKAARDHAFHTRDTQGVPLLLPRPTQKELARRLGITESRISRSLNDPEATQLKLLWNLADDLDQILRHG
ncbi:MAG: hypothetical protein ACK5Q5_08590 [Planctomycetaceae bacterium]